MSSFKIAVVVSATLALAGCAFQKYHPAPLSAPQTAASLEARTLSDPGLRQFIAENSPLAAAWPPPQWDLRGLTLAAFYFNPALRVARARVSQAQAAVLTARARPNPGASADFGGETAPESPWIAGVGFSLPLETAGKRGHRVRQAERLADVARWDLAITAWNVRAQLRAALLEYVAAKHSLDLLQAEEGRRAEQAHLLDQRLAVGLISRPEADLANLQHTQSLLAVGAAQGRAAQAEAALAAATGVPTAALQRVKIAWPGFDGPPSPASLTPAAIQQEAVLNRLDIRRALADYSASEAALQLEIARQYPNFNLGPDYAFEEGAHLFSVAMGLALPIFDRNQGAIAEAKARREQMAAQFLAVQAAGIAKSEQALAAYQAALQQLEQARQLLSQSLAQEQAAHNELQAGAGDRVALNGAQLQSAVSSLAVFNALCKAQQALGDLEDAVQRPLLPDDIQPLSPQSPLLKAAARK